MSLNGTIYLSGKKEAQNRELSRLDKLAKETNHVIFTLSSVFPFQLFPDSIIIDENKITIIRKSLFSKRVYPITYDHLVTVKVNRSILFASLEFEVLRFAQDPSPVTHLHPTEANLAKKYIIAMMQAIKYQIDFSKLDISDVRAKLEKIGSPENEAEHLF